MLSGFPSFLNSDLLYYYYLDLVPVACFALYHPFHLRHAAWAAADLTSATLLTLSR